MERDDGLDLVQARSSALTTPSAASEVLSQTADRKVPKFGGRMLACGQQGLPDAIEVRGRACAPQFGHDRAVTGIVKSEMRSNA